MAKTKYKRVCKGKVPQAVEGGNPYFLEVSFFDEFSGTAWEIYTRKSSNETDWTNYKVICIDRTKGGANFWIGCNFLDQRFAKSYQGALVFNEKKPSAFLLFCQAIDIFNPQEWIANTQSI